MQKWRCTICGYVYDPAVGDPENGIAAGTPFEELPDSWECPRCGVAKALFEVIEGNGRGTGRVNARCSDSENTGHVSRPR